MCRFFMDKPYQWGAAIFPAKFWKQTSFQNNNIPVFFLLSLELNSHFNTFVVCVSSYKGLMIYNIDDH